MAKSMEEINAEKRTKSRPDLIPAEVYRRFRRAITELMGTDGRNDPLPALFDFASTGNVEHLFRAMAITHKRTGRTHGTGLAMGRVLAYGLAKHGVCTWRVAGTEQADPQTHYASALRHILEHFEDPNAVEEGSKFPVLDHALTQMAILADLVLDPPKLLNENDGRWAIVSARKPTTPELHSDFEWVMDTDDGTWSALYRSDHRHGCVYYPRAVWPNWEGDRVSCNPNVPDSVRRAVALRNEGK
jgi:hypothetical protein